MASRPKKAIAVLICSTRPIRLNPVVAHYVLDVMNTVPQTGDQARIDLVDLAHQNLPLYNEPAVPGELPVNDPTSHYAHAHTRAWSALVRQYDAFVFVTPQYNWSVPAGLKNCLDYLFHEWKGKPAAIVTYGNHGGVKAADHLRQILAGLRMGDVAEPIVALRTVKGVSGDLGTILPERWLRDRDDGPIKTMFGHLLRLLS